MPLFPPCQRCKVLTGFEKPDKVADIRYTAGKSDIVDGCVRIFKLFLGIGNARIDQIVLQSDADIMFEFPGKVIFADMLGVSQKREGKFLLKMGIDIFHTAAYIIRKYGVVI